MARIHSIVLAYGATETRKSESRHYTACVVSTVTDATIASYAAKKTEIEAELAAARVVCAERMALYGMTVEQATAWHKDVSAKWYGRDENTHAKLEAPGYHDVFEELRAGRSNFFGEAAHEATTKAMIKRGYVKPYDVESPYGILYAAQAVASREKTLADWRDPVLGAQGVLSWHGTAALAHKEIGSGTARHFAEEGYKLEVRGDIAVRETVKRAPKTATP